MIISVCKIKTFHCLACILFAMLSLYLSLARRASALAPIASNGALPLCELFVSSGGRGTGASFTAQPTGSAALARV